MVETPGQLKKRDSTTFSIGDQTDLYTGYPILATYNPCSPWLSIPQKIHNLDTLWSTCFPVISAVYDPDNTLTAGPVFGPVTAHPPIPTLAHPGDAIAGQSISQVLATSTLPPNLPSAQPNAPPSNQPNVPPPPAFSRVAPVVSFGTTTITANSASEIVIGTRTFKPGDQGIVSGTTVYYASHGEYLNVGGTTQNINLVFAVGTQTISESGPGAVISGKTYSVEAGGSSVVIDGTTEAVSQATQAAVSAQKVWMTVPAYIIDGQTMIAGGLPITSGDTVMSLELNGESVVVVVSKTMDINDVLGSTTSSDSLSQFAFGTNSTSIGGMGSGTTSSIVSPASSSMGPPNSETTAARRTTKSGARRGTDSSCRYTWLVMAIGIAAVMAVL